MNCHYFFLYRDDYWVLTYGCSRSRVEAPPQLRTVSNQALKIVCYEKNQAACVKALVPWWHYASAGLPLIKRKKRFADALYHARAVTLSAAALSCFKGDSSSSSSTATFRSQHFTNGDLTKENTHYKISEQVKTEGTLNNRQRDGL